MNGLRDLMQAGHNDTKDDNVKHYSSYQLNKAKADLRLVDIKLTSSKAKRDLLLEQRKEAEERKNRAEAEVGKYDLVQILLNMTSEYARNQAKGRLEEIVSEALNVVFGGTHRFIIDVQMRANRPEVDYILDDGETITHLKKPDYDNGGGIVDVVSLALRLGVAELEGADGPLLLDEVGKHISEEYAENVAYFLKEYSNTFGRQIILITHNKALAEVGDLNLEIKKVKGISQVKVIGGSYD